MLGVNFNGKSVAEMSLQYLSKPDPPPYNAAAARRTHDYMQNDQSNMENKTQQHSINDILNSNKQGKHYRHIISPPQQNPF